MAKGYAASLLKPTLKKNTAPTGTAAAMLKPQLKAPTAPTAAPTLNNPWKKQANTGAIDAQGFRAAEQKTAYIPKPDPKKLQSQKAIIQTELNTLKASPNLKNPLANNQAAHARISTLESQLSDVNKQLGVIEMSDAERTGRVVLGGVEKAVGGTVNAVNLAGIKASNKIETSQSDLYKKLMGESKYQETANKSPNFKPDIRDNTKIGFADKLYAAGNENTSRATKGMDDLSKFALEGVSSISNMATGAALAKLTGVPFSAVMGVQAGGNAAMDAKAQGKTLDQQIEYGLSTGVSTGLIEALGGIGASTVAKGIAGKFAASVLAKLPSTIVKWANTTGAKVVGKILGDALSEGGEEAIQYSTDILLQKLTLDNDVPFDIKQMAYQALQGGTIGGLFGAATSPSVINANQTPIAQNNAIQEQPTAPAQTPTAIEQPVQTTKPLPTSQSAQDATGAVTTQAKPEAIVEHPKGTGAAEAGFDTMGTLVDKFGAQKSGALNATDRVVEFATQSSPGKYIPKTAQSAAESRVTPVELAQDIETAAANGVWSFDRNTDKGAISRGIDRIAKATYWQSVKDFSNTVAEGKVSKDDIVVGQLLYVHAANVGDQATATDILTDLFTMQHFGAQATQAAFILKKLTPQWQLYATESVVRKLNEKLHKTDNKFKMTKQQSEQSDSAAKKMSEAATEESKTAVDDVIGEIENATKKRNGSSKLSQEAKDDIKLATQDANREHGPDVDQWASETGKLLAKAIGNQIDPKSAATQQSLADTVLGDLKKFVAVNKPKRAVETTLNRSAIDRFTDFINNPQFYAEAWGKARLELKQKYAGDSGMMFALDNILNGDLQQSAEAYLNKQLDTMINSALKDIKVTIGSLVDQSAASKADIITRVSDLLIKKYNVEGEMATTISERISERLAEVIKQRAAKRLAAMFPVKVNDAKAKKSIEDKLARMINLGAFDSTSFNSLAAERLFNIKDVTIDPKLTSDFLEAKTEDERSKAIKAIYNNIAEQIPASPMEKLNALRYCAMLLNPGTHWRNVYSNSVFRFERFVRNMMSVGFQSGWNKLASTPLGKKLQPIDRTRTILTRADKELITDCRNDYQNAVEDIYRFGKYDDASNQIEDARKIFGQGGNTKVGNLLSNTLGKGTEAVRQFNIKAMTKEDGLVTIPAYTHALAGYLKVNGATFKTASPQLLTEARAFAIQDAKVASYRDSNEFSDLIARLGKNYSGNNKIAKVANVAVEGLLPFKRTPANVARQGFKFSPLGLINTIVTGSKKLNNPDSNYTSSDFIDDVSSGLVGTALYGLGMLLCRWGIIEIVGDGDDKENALEKTQNKQSYSINAFGVNVPIDFIATVSMPLFMGAKSYELMTRKSEPIQLKDALSIASDVTGPILETSMLSAVSDFLENFSWAQSENMNYIYYGLMTAATSYLGQFVPSALGAIARTADPTRRTYFTDSQSGIPKEFQYFAQRQMAKIPGLSSKLQPYVDQWGRTQTSGIGESIAENFASPFKANKVNVSPMETEIQRLYTDYAKENEVTVMPPASVRKYFSNNGDDVYMTADEYTQFKITLGKTAYSELTKLISSAEYKAMKSDKDKAKAVEEIWEAAQEKAKTEVMESKGEMRIPTTDDDKKMQSFIDVSGISMKQSYDLKKALDALKPLPNEKKVSDYQRISTVLSQPLTQKQKTDIISTYFTSHDDEGNVKSQSLLPYLNNADHLIALYKTTQDTNYISMVIPETLTENKIEYKLTASEKALFKKEYIKFFNNSITSTATKEFVARLREKAQQIAKMAVIRSRAK